MEVYGSERRAKIIRMLQDRKFSEVGGPCKTVNCCRSKAEYAIVPFRGNDVQFKVRKNTWDEEVVTMIESEYRRSFGLPIDGLPIIDIGAHVGGFCKLASIAYPSSEIHCFEPDYDSFSLLRENIAGTKCVPCNKGISGDKILGKLVKGIEPCTNRTIWEDIPEKGWWCSNLDTIKCVPINDVLDQFAEIGLLKMDCEGAELIFLPHLSETNRKKIRFIVGEIHPDKNNNAERIRQLFEDFNIIIDKNFGRAKEQLFFGWRKDVDYACS
jgi:FkbM family methyltransferase